MSSSRPPVSHLMRVVFSIFFEKIFDVLATALEVKKIVMEAAKLQNVYLMVMYCGKRLGDYTTLDQTDIAVGDVLQIMVFANRR